MTYCVGLLLNEGIVFGSDSRTHAGVDDFASFCKMTVFEQPGERVLVLLSSGSLAGTQAVISVLTQGAVVLLFTDGLERDPDDRLEFEIDRLHRSCRRLIWLNPLLRFDGFEAKARGIKVMLPHVDELRPIHNLHSMEELCRALSLHGREVDAKTWLQRVA